MARVKHKKNQGRFAGVPFVVMNNPDYIKLGFSARALLYEFALQYNRENNGKLCAVHSQLCKRGWGSEETLRKNIKELLDANLITLTKHGMYGVGKRLPNYYAINWQPIDDIKGFDMDVNPTVTPIRKFETEMRLIQNSKVA